MRAITRIMSTALCTLLVSTVFDCQTLSDLKRQLKLHAPLARLILMSSVLAWSAVNVDGQEIARHGKTQFLPPATGEALTLTPTDMPDVSCSAVEWKYDTATPTLAVICPPQDTSAPLHIYFKLSWLKPEDVPVSVRGITVPAKTLVKIRTSKATAWVWLAIREKHGAPPHGTWMAFNGVLDMALLTLSPRR